MTRVNVGIPPWELCDQMLLAEYRELPRCFNTRRDAGLDKFRLNAGHMLWCAQYQWSLLHRHMRLCDEMLHRGFIVNHRTTWAEVDECSGKAWSNHDENYARPLLYERIIKQLGRMKRKPKWTKRSAPEWVANGF